MKARMPKGKVSLKLLSPFSLSCLLPRSPALPSEQLHWGFIKLRLRPPHSWRPAAFQAGIITDWLTPKPIKLAQQAAAGFPAFLLISSLRVMNLYLPLQVCACHANPGGPLWQNRRMLSTYRPAHPAGSNCSIEHLWVNRQPPWMARPAWTLLWFVEWLRPESPPLLCVNNRGSVNIGCRDCRSLSSWND